MDQTVMGMGMLTISYLVILTDIQPFPTVTLYSVNGILVYKFSVFVFLKARAFPHWHSWRIEVMCAPTAF